MSEVPTTRNTGGDAANDPPEIWDSGQFAALFDRHRRELLVHCYRMTGSFTEAEDLVQETFERAWRRVGGFHGESSMRTWLYTIATNASIDALRRRKRRRVLPFDVMRPIGPGGPVPGPPDQAWLEPFPDRLLAGAGSGDPEDTVVSRETIELAFLAAIQHLPPRQRAVFIARDVMGWSTKATTVVVGASEASVKSALQRARATMKQHLPQSREAWGQEGTVDEEERDVLERYMDAHRLDDIEALAELLAEDVRVAYPQIPLWSDSRDAFIQATREFAPPGEYRFVPTSANRQPAVAIYLRPPGETRFQITALELLRVESGKVVEIVDFDLGDLYPAFGIPMTLA